MRRPARLLLALVIVAGAVVVAPTAASTGITGTRCARLWPGLEAFTVDGRCLLLHEAAVGATTARVYVHEDVGDRAADDDVILRTFAALTRSIDVYTSLGTMPARVDIALIPRLAPEDGDAYASVDDHGACVVTTGLATFRHRLRFQHTLAHELFHCFQYHLIGPESTSSGGRHSTWWYEGTAEYFANVVFPKQDLEHEFLPDLRAFERDRSLVGLATESEIFFQHFANLGGDAAIIDLMKTLPTTGSRARQVEALGAWPGMAALFHDFARALLADEVIDTNGSEIPAHVAEANRGRFRIDDAGVVFDFAHLAPFRVHRVIVTFDELLRLDVRYVASPGVRIGVEPLRSPGPWKDALPALIDTCDGARRFQVVLTTIDPAGGQATLRVSPGGQATGGAPLPVWATGAATCG